MAVLLLVLCLCGGFVLRHFRNASNSGAQTYFYDQSKAKLFTASRHEIPPIPGLDNPEPDAVRAVVISTTGDPDDLKSRRIAYLEKYSATLKNQMANAQKSGAPPEIGRAEAMQHRFVKRVRDSLWVPLGSAEGERIVTEWTSMGQGGATPVVCVP